MKINSVHYLVVGDDKGNKKKIHVYVNSNHHEAINLGTCV